MITQDMYKEILGISQYGNPTNQHGNTISQARKRKSAQIFNATFTNDVGYKKVYILTERDGWQWVDAKYSKHQTPTLSNMETDYYLQFRPTYEQDNPVNYPVGTYVFIPNEDTDMIPFDKSDEDYPNPKNPIQQCIKEFSPYYPNSELWNNLWMVTYRDYDTEFIRYSILKCNHVFRWINDGKMYNVAGALRIRSSYTAGLWSADYMVQLDNVTQGYIPNLSYIYKDKLDEYRLGDTNKLVLDTRFMFSTNPEQPKCYLISKVMEMAPKGIIDVTFKQDTFDEKRDNPELFCCNYYDDSGEAVVDITPTPSKPTETDKCELYQYSMDEDGNAVKNETVQPLQIGGTTYYSCEYGSENPDAIWTIECIDDISDNEKTYYCKMLKLTIYDDENVAIAVSRANSVIGHKFRLTVVNNNNANETASLDLEVSG